MSWRTTEGQGEAGEHARATDLPAATARRNKRLDVARALHRCGKTTSEIAAQLGVSYAYTRGLQVQAGITPHRAPRCKGLTALNAARSQAMTERRARIAKWLRADPLITHEQLARTTGVSEDTIRSDRLAVRTQAQSE